MNCIIEVDSESSEDPKIGDFFGKHRKQNSRNAVVYSRQGDYIVIEVITSGRRADLRNFRIGKDDEEICKFMFDKLGVNQKAYKKNKRIVWQ